MNSDSGGLEDLSQIAALLKCVETGGASEHVLGQLQMFPEIRGQRGINKRRDVYRKLPRRAKRRVVKGRLERKRWRTNPLCRCTSLQADHTCVVPSSDVHHD